MSTYILYNTVTDSHDYRSNENFAMERLNFVKSSLLCEQVDRPAQQSLRALSQELEETEFDYFCLRIHEINLLASHCPSCRSIISLVVPRAMFIVSRVSSFAQQQLNCPLSCIQVRGKDGFARPLFAGQFNLAKDRGRRRHRRVFSLDRFS